MGYLSREFFIRRDVVPYRIRMTAALRRELGSDWVRPFFRGGDLFLAPADERTGESRRLLVVGHGSYCFNHVDLFDVLKQKHRHYVTLTDGEFQVDQEGVPCYANHRGPISDERS